MEPKPSPETETQEVVPYKILTYENYLDRVVGELGIRRPSFEDDEQMRAQYIERTDNLIFEIEKQEVDMVLFLDKSARPIQWMVKELWPIFAPGKKIPASKFVNIDASFLLHRGAENSRPTDEEVDNFEVKSEYIEELRDIFKDPDDPTISVFDGKKIMVVDEVSVTGGSLRIALKLLRAAFPNAEFVAKSWMNSVETLPNEAKRVIELPVWYSHLRVSGRGIGDVKEGSTFLSARLSNDEGLPDEDSLQLRKEFKQLARDIESGKQEIIPAFKRDNNFYFETLTLPNGEVVEKTDLDGRPKSRFKIRQVN